MGIQTQTDERLGTSTPMARAASALTQISRTARRRLAADITGPLARRPALKLSASIAAAGKHSLFRMRNAWTEVTGGAWLKLLLLWRCRVASGKRPEIYRYTKPNISFRGSTASLSKAFNLTAAHMCLARQMRISVDPDQGRNDLRMAGRVHGTSSLISELRTDLFQCGDLLVLC